MSRVSQQLPRFSISQVSTLAASFADDVHAYAAAGVEGIGLWELKLGAGPDDEAHELLAASGLGLASAVPAVPSVLPLPLLPGPADPAERVESLCASVRRLAAFGVPAVVCLTGPAGGREPDEARALVVDGLRAVAREAEQAGVRLALEPFQRQGIEHWSLVNTLGEAAELVAEVGSDAVGIQFDVWHLWNTPDLLEEIPRYAHLLAGVHVDDWREPTRGWADRVLPGDGVADLSAILGALDEAGWDGFYDLEIFSDDGAFGSAYPDSLWALGPAELARRGREAFERCWSQRRVTAQAVVRRGET
ncbi:MAG TPA: sugar phosphate isomerase/epimerase family protein [Gaiellaceae bacterium]|nr:sugar phosphate isomerase/epimerase family protein [Gaiellaceae bacterium]